MKMIMKKFQVKYVVRLIFLTITCFLFFELYRDESRIWDKKSKSISC